MLFVLDKSLADHLDDANIQQALFYIALGRREGKHLIFCDDRKTVKAFFQSNALDTQTRSVYKNIYEKLTSLKIYYDIFIRRVRVTADSNITDISWKISGNVKEILIPASLIKDSYIIQQTILLCENLTDCKIYERMARVSMIWKDKGKVKIAYEAKGGGGSTIAPEYQMIQTANNRFCLCISESDKKSPKSKIGDTARKLQKTDKTEQLLTECIIISVREIENLIPASVYNKTGDPNRKQFIDFLKDTEQSQWRRAAYYIDIKKGITGKDFFAGQRDDNPDWWKDFQDSVRDSVQNCLLEDCKDRQKCPKKKKENCKCIAIEGMGEKILKDVVDFLAKQDPEETAEIVTEDVNPYWQEYGELLAAWCCADDPIKY